MADDPYLKALRPVRNRPMYQSPLGTGAGPKLTLPPVTSGASAAVGPRALQALGSLGRLSAFLAPAAALAVTGYANEPAIDQAATNWISGLSMPLDDGLKGKLNTIKTEAAPVLDRKSVV